MKKIIVVVSCCLLILCGCKTTMHNDKSSATAQIDNEMKTSVTPLKFKALSDSTAEVIRNDSYKNLDTITIPDRVQIDGNVYVVTSVGEHAFDGCKKLKRLNMPSNIAEIKDAAFWECGLTSVVIPPNVSSIGAYAFTHCLNLEYIEIPPSVTTIGDSSFDMCYNLQTINVASDNFFYSSMDGVLYDKKKSIIIRVPPQMSGDFVIPLSVTKIEQEAFGNCEKITSVKMPSNLTSIGEKAFFRCNSLKDIEIPQSVTYIGSDVFWECVSLTRVELPSGIKNIYHGLFYGCSRLSNVVIPQGVTLIDELAFSRCSSLTNIVIPNTVRAIRSSAFMDCTGLTAIDLPLNIEYIQGRAFKNLKSFRKPHLLIYNNGTKCYGWIGDEDECTKIVIPNGVKEIGDNAFVGCKMLEYVEIPESVSVIQNYAFDNCENLDVVIHNSEENVKVGFGAFGRCKSVKYTK